MATQRHGRMYWKRQSRAFFVIRAARVLLDVAKFGEEEYQRLPQFVRPGAYVIDVGANSGVYTFRLSRLVSKSGLVLSVEPYSPLAGRLRLACRVLRRRNIRVFEMALADKAGRSGLVAPMLTRDIIDDGQVHLVSAGESAVAEVEVGTLDGLVDSQRLPHVDLLKIDVEGAEQAVLLGASKTLSTFRPTLICEIQDLWAGRYGTTAQRSFDLLTQLYGYRPHAFIDGRLVPVGRPVEGLINYVFLQPPDVSRN